MKKRIDQILLIKKIVNSRQKAQELIKNKMVTVDNKFILKPNTIINDSSDIKIINHLKYVSRAGNKLEKAIHNFNINVNNLVCLDIGSSTGGFTDCLLQFNAKLIYALDVGTNQLDWKIRSNNKVIVMEKTNFKYCKSNDFDNEIEFSCCDVSFISLEKIIPILSNILINNGNAILLIKPQFETKKENVKKGKIIDNKIHINVIEKIILCAINNNFDIINLTYSPILGNKKKNIEYLLHIKKNTIVQNKINNINVEKIIQIVKEAWYHLL